MIDKTDRLAEAFGLIHAVSRKQNGFAVLGQFQQGVFERD
jgi:hypothetical protein